MDLTISKTLARQIKEGMAHRCIECSVWHSAASLKCKECKKKWCKVCKKYFLSESSNTCKPCLKKDYIR